MKNLRDIEEAWNAHLKRSFPRQCAGQEIDGVCLTSCDTYLAGCASSVIHSAAFDPGQSHLVASVSADLRRVLPHLEGDAFEYFTGLLALGAALEAHANVR